MVISIVDMFDVTNVDHVKEFNTFLTTGTLSTNSVFIECIFPLDWEVQILKLLALAHIHYWFRIT